MKNLLLIISFFAFVNLNAQEITIEDKINKMLDVMGSKKNFEVVIDNMINIQKDGYKGTLSEEFFEEFRKETKEGGYLDLLEELIPVYKRNFTEEEIDGIIQFYESDIGKSYVNKLPVVMAESMRIGGEWGGKLGKEIFQKLEKSKEVMFNKINEFDCEFFKVGEFISNPQGEYPVEIIREGGIQVEKYDGGELKYQIEWSSNCRYSIIEIKENKSFTPNDTIEVNIIEVTGDSYKYIAKSKGGGPYIEGEMIKK